MASGRHGTRWRWHRALALALVLGLLAPALPAAARLAPKKQEAAPIVFRADQVQYDQKRALTLLKGHVEISQGDETLLADTVTYNQRTDTVTASGHVSLLQPSGDILFTKFIELRDNMNSGFAKNVRMLLSDRSRLAANAARRTGGNRTELARVVYSPCDLCKDNPRAPPAWQLKAGQVVHDQKRKLIEFRDATMEIDGLPVFYVPYMSMPDPTVKRASGFLTPSIGSSSTVGAHVAIPYFLVLGPDKDLTLSPRFTTGAGPVAAGEYRQRFANGYLDATGSLNYSSVGAFTTEKTGNAWRGHINAHGVFDLDPTYRAGFDLERVSDQTYLLRFGFGSPPLNAMVSRAYLQGFDPRGGTDANAYMFQPLLPGLGDSTQPIVLPEINRFWQSRPDSLGGRWHLNANLLNIVREVGTQTRRLSLGSVWERRFRDGIGGDYKFTASLRGDAYSIAGLSPVSNPTLPSAYFPVDGMPAAEPINHDFVTGRLFPQLGLVWRYPLIRRGGRMSELIEPIAAAFVGPTGGNQRRIPNEDSLSFDYNATDLFRSDRLPGYDVLDTGQRVDYGLKLGLYDETGGSYRLLMGQSYRAEDNPFLPLGSGVEQRLSDVVGRVVLQPSSYLDLIYRFRLDKSSLGNRSQELGVSAGPPNLRLNGNFLLIPAQKPSAVVTNPVSGLNVVYGKREQLSFGIDARVTRYWSLHGSETINLTNSDNIVNGIVVPQATSTSLYATISAVYEDECMAFIGSLSQSGIRSGDVTPGVSVLFSVVFKNLGEVGGTLASFGGTTTQTAP